MSGSNIKGDKSEHTHSKYRADDKYTRNCNRQTYTRYSLLGVSGDDGGIILKRILQIYNDRLKTGFNLLTYGHAPDKFTANSSATKLRFVTQLATVSLSSRTLICRNIYL